MPASSNRHENVESDRAWCFECGYDLRLLDDSGRCPECGSDIADVAVMVPRKRVLHKFRLAYVGITFAMCILSATVWFCLLPRLEPISQVLVLRNPRSVKLMYSDYYEVRLRYRRTRLELGMNGYSTPLMWYTRRPKVQLDGPARELEVVIDSKKLTAEYVDADGKPHRDNGITQSVVLEWLQAAGVDLACEQVGELGGEQMRLQAVKQIETEAAFIATFVNDRVKGEPFRDECSLFIYSGSGWSRPADGSDHLNFIIAGIFVVLVAVAWLYLIMLKRKRILREAMKFI